MKTIIAIALVGLAIVVSLGATRINKKPAKAELQVATNRGTEPAGGLVSEGH